MTYIFEKALAKTYSEIGQNNPIRWEVLRKTGKTFTPQSGKIKCKDFFNDLAYKLVTKKSFQIYGFSPAAYKLNRSGVWMRLTSVNTDYFAENIENCVINPIKEELGVEVKLHKVDDTTYLLFLPMVLWKTTYRISIVSYVVRACSYGQQLKDLTELFSNDHINGLENNLANPKVVAFHKKWGYSGPVDNQLICSSVELESADSYQIPGIVHNNGMVQWANNYKG